MDIENRIHIHNGPLFSCKKKKKKKEKRKKRKFNLKYFSISCTKCLDKILVFISLFIYLACHNSAQDHIDVFSALYNPKTQRSH